MASGDQVVMILEEIPPAANAPGLSFLAGGSTPAESIPVWLFDPTAVEYIDYKCQLVGYGGGGLTIRLKWSSDATSGDVVWQAAIRRIADDAEDLDGSHTYVFNTATVTTATAAGEVDYATITFTDGADMDSLADGEYFILRVARLSTDGNDTMNSDDAELHAVTGEET